MKKILILGKAGMLGSMLSYYFLKNYNYKVFTTSRAKSDTNNLFFDAIESNVQILSDFIKYNKIEYVINAIGIIKPYCKDDDVEGVRKAILVNAMFPHKLADISKKTKIIQIATDCVFSGKTGSYNEKSPHDPLDVYGKTKSLGELNDGSILNIRCSIIGPEIRNKLSLLEWFLNQPSGSELNGYSHHRWNGITTLRFAKLINFIVQNNLYQKMIDASPVHHLVPGYMLTKYEMLMMFNKIFNKKHKIAKVDNIGPSINRSLSTIYSNLKPFSNTNFEEDIIELKKIMYDDFYSYDHNK